MFEATHWMKNRSTTCGGDVFRKYCPLAVQPGLRGRYVDADGHCIWPTSKEVEPIPPCADCGEPAVCRDGSATVALCQKDYDRMLADDPGSTPS